MCLRSTLATRLSAAAFPVGDACPRLWLAGWEVQSGNLGIRAGWPTVGMAQDGLGRAHGSNSGRRAHGSNSHQPLQIGDLRLIILTHQPSKIIANVLISDFE